MMVLLCSLLLDHAAICMVQLYLDQHHWVFWYIVQLSAAIPVVHHDRDSVSTEYTACIDVKHALLLCD